MSNEHDIGKKTKQTYPHYRPGVRSRPSVRSLRGVPGRLGVPGPPPPAPTLVAAGSVSRRSPSPARVARCTSVTALHAAAPPSPVAAPYPHSPERGAPRALYPHHRWCCCPPRRCHWCAPRLPPSPASSSPNRASSARPATRAHVRTACRFVCSMSNLNGRSGRHVRICAARPSASGRAFARRSPCRRRSLSRRRSSGGALRCACPRSSI
jgi:hypothetical protein